MISQLMTVPIVLRRGDYTKVDLEKLGDVTESGGNWVLEYTAEVNYFGDDETFIYDFWHAVAGKGLELDRDSLIRFEWDKAQKVKRPLP